MAASPFQIVFVFSRYVLVYFEKVHTVSMEHLHEDLIVQIYEKKPLNTSTNSHNDKWMLKYTIQNLGFICFLMRADFQQSENIQLLRLSSSKTWTKISSLSFESEVRPFENKEIVRAMKINPKERAFVRVQYEVIEEKDMPLDQVMENQTQEKQEMGDIIEYSTNKYQSSQQAMLMKRSMDLQDISHFYRTNDDVFLDLTFPPTLDSLLGDDFQSINETDIYTLCTFKHYQDINHLSSDKEWKLQVNYCRDDDKIIQIFPGGLPKAPGILSAFAIILERQDQNLLERMRCKLVDNFSKSSCFEFQFCLSGQWEKVLVDGFLPCFPGGGSMGISSLSHLSLSLQLIQKAYAKLKGSYSALTNVSTLQALSEMTGLPAFLLYKHEEASSISTSHVSALLQRALNSKREQLFVSFQEMTLEKMMFAVLRIENDNQGTYVVLRDMWKMLRQVYSGTVTISTGNEMTIRMPLEEFIQSVASIGMLHLSSLSLDKDQDIRRRLCFYQPDKVALDPDDMSPYQTPDYKLLDQKHLALPLESFAFCFSLTALSSVSITLYRRECSLNGRMHLIDDEEELFALALLNADYCLTSLRSKHTHTHYFVKKDEIMIEEHVSYMNISYLFVLELINFFCFVL
jgi:hypothetical protein